MESIISYDLPSMRYDQIDISNTGRTHSVISELDIQILKAQINSIDLRIRHEIISKILDLNNLGEDWDSYGATKITVDAIAKAHYFISKVAEDKNLILKLPSVSPEPNGGILLKWYKNNSEFLVWFTAKEEHYIYLESVMGVREGSKVGSMPELLIIFKKWAGRY